MVSGKIFLLGKYSVPDKSRDGSAIGLGTFDTNLKVLDGAVFSMNPDQVPKGLDQTPAQLQGLDVMLAAQVSIYSSSSILATSNHGFCCRVLGCLQGDDTARKYLQWTF